MFAVFRVARRVGVEENVGVVEGVGRAKKVTWKMNVDINSMWLGFAIFELVGACADTVALIANPVTR